jgi:membrane protease subunit (stomatin/prohibitin family)
MNKEEFDMGIIRAAVQSAKSGLADQWLEVIEPESMGDQTLLTAGVKINRKSQNRKGTKDVISNGSVIHVYDNQFMILTDGGKVIDYTAEPGYYTVNNETAPSMFDGSFSDALEESFQRIKFGGQTPAVQKVYYINLQEIKGIKFGTRNPINYFDNFYNAELFLRAHGTYSIRITDPLKFYAEVVPRNQEQVEVSDINEQFLNEFLDALQSSINQMSVDGIRISFVTSKGRELSKYMADTLDEDWRQNRGMEIVSVGIASVSYDETSTKLINMRNEGAMLSDPTIREGYVQGSVARGMEAAGSNANGSMAGFMGMGMGMQSAGGFMGSASAANMQQMEMMRQQQALNAQQQTAAAQTMGNPTQQPTQNPNQAASWTCSCGSVNTGKFCPECGSPAPAAEWTCSCGSVNKGKFCPNCGNARP